MLLGLAGWRSAIAPVAPSTAAVYTAETIEKGRQLAALGNCAHCHTVDAGKPLAGGLAMDTPFGTVYTTNITPDVATGIGAWSFSAFQRAMREGISRDGRHLYPAFPYTAFTRMGDDDLTALYAYLMNQKPVVAELPATQLKFPFNARPLLAGWNALHLDAGPRKTTETTRSELWQRGEYLVNGVGHCGACHTERNALGAERDGKAFLGGAMVKGWEAPSLTARHPGPVPWTEDAFYSYLRQGHSAQHGMAGAAATQAISTAAAGAPQLQGPAQRMFDQACAACHHDGNGPRLLGVNVPLALNSNLHSERPDNLLRTLLEGVQDPATRDIGFMPAFKDALDDRQLVELAAYMRQRFAPQQPAWVDLPAAVARARAASQP